MPWVQDASSIGGERLLESFPYTLRDTSASAHAIQELNERIAWVETLRPTELEHVRYRLEDFNCILDLETRRLFVLIVTIWLLRIEILHQANVSCRTKLEAIAQVDDDGYAPEMMIRPPIRPFRDAVCSTAAQH